MNKKNRIGYWVCIRNGRIYLHCGYKKYNASYDPKSCYVIDEQMYNRINKDSAKKKGRTKKNNK